MPSVGSMSRGIAIAAMVVGLAAQTVVAQTCGDADGSGTINLTDGVVILGSAAGLGEACGGSACDVDGNGSVSVSDGVATLRMAAQLPVSVSCGTRFGTLVKRVDGEGGAGVLRLGLLRIRARGSTSPPSRVRPRFAATRRLR